jgi:hypothetical protein
MPDDKRLVERFETNRVEAFALAGAGFVIIIQLATLQGTSLWLKASLYSCSIAIPLLLASALMYEEMAEQMPKRKSVDLIVGSTYIIGILLIVSGVASYIAAFSTAAALGFVGASALAFILAVTHYNLNRSSKSTRDGTQHGP